MNLILKIYLAGVLLNLVVFAYQHYKYKGELNIKGVIGFLLASWIVYPLVLIQSKRY